VSPFNPLKLKQITIIEKSQVPRHGGEKGEKREKREEKRGKKGGRKEGR
jgi:hypothetical protein